jgi:hypothetical protein
VELSSPAVDDYASRLVELLERCGVVLTKPAPGKLVDVLEADDGSLSFELIGSLPDGHQPALSTLELRERFHPIEFDRYERAGYEYELLDHERDFRRAFHLHDPEWFERNYLVLVHEHCERPIKHVTCTHYHGSPVRDAYAGVVALIGAWTDEPPVCSKLLCFE